MLTIIAFLLPGLFSSSVHAAPVPGADAPRPVARVEVSTFWVDFNDVEVDDHEDEEFTLENTGDVPVKVEDIDFDGDSDVFDLDQSCPDVLEPGDDCDLTVTFHPEEPGRFSGDVEIETSIGRLHVNVSGEAVDKF